MLLGVAVIIGFRLLADGFGWENLSYSASILGMLLVTVSIILGLIGMYQDRRSTLNRRLDRLRNRPAR